MSDFNEWLDAALIVAGSNGMADSQVIPTWLADVADKFPALTVGALRKLHADRKGTVNCPPAASVNVVHGHRVIQWTAKPLPVGTKLYAGMPSAGVPKGWKIEPTREGSIAISHLDIGFYISPFPDGDSRISDVILHALATELQQPPKPEGES
ncbi:hypothetical protein [Marinobacter sp. KMM 10035]|uniref:hypothetical protein n=1 Tax=Marinobacter sp. KMM 10035 TaxID=3134034 RepID=UPI003978C1A5